MTDTRTFHLGPMFRRAANRHGAVFVTLDRPLDVRPGLGVSLTYTALADLVDELSARLWAAGIRPRQRVAVHKRDNVDIVLLTCALSRIGAVPALLSPSLSGPVTGQLLKTLDRPWLITDSATLEGPLKDIGVPDLVRRTLTVDETAEMDETDDADHAPGAVPLARYAGARPPTPRAAPAPRTLPDHPQFGHHRRAQARRALPERPVEPAHTAEGHGLAHPRRDHGAAPVVRAHATGSVSCAPAPAATGRRCAGSSSSGRT
ncbi:AMP-binding protein [Streptomyces sp. NPDC093984]|uniref:AMP-binding protein n=1 Tax=Streptomyces sp. NPDC093984 TaxID=3366052 RepID=UPI0038037648